MTEPEDSEQQLFEDLTPLIKVARRGFRSDVAQLVGKLPSGGFLVPLSKSLQDIELGEAVKPDEEVTLKPHLLPDADGTFFVALFTDTDVLSSVGEYLGWSTDDGEELQYCTLPAPVALDLALQLVDEQTVMGAVINPSDEFELLLRRHELGAPSQGRALPLVGYVDQIPIGDEEKVLISELEAAPSPELILAIESCIKKVGGVKSYTLTQTFNAERDLEPHPTLTLAVEDPTAVDSEQLNIVLAAELEGKLPPPGYIDVLFDTDNTKAD